MIDLGHMEMVLNGGAIAEANAARTAAEEARQAVASKAAEVVTPMAVAAEASTSVVAVAEKPTADNQTLLRFAYLGRMGLLTPGQFASVGERLRTANIEIPNGAGGAGWNLAF